MKTDKVIIIMLTFGLLIIGLIQAVNRCANKVTPPLQAGRLKGGV